MCGQGHVISAQTVPPLAGALGLRTFGRKSVNLQWNAVRRLDPTQIKTSRPFSSIATMYEHVFREFEAYANAVQHADLRCLIPRLESPTWSISHFDLGGVLLQRASEGGGNIAQGVARNDGYVLYVQRSGTWGRVNGVQLEPGDVAFLEPGAEFCIASDDAHDWSSVFVPAERLSPAAARSCDRSKTDHETRVLHPGIETSGHLLSLVDRLAYNAAIDPAVLTHSASISSVREEVASSFHRIVGCIPSGTTQHIGRPALSRREILEKAVTLAEERPDVPNSVRSLAVGVGVSERTLRKAFSEYFGMPPFRFFVLRRLHTARHRLRSGDPDQITVSEVAVELGFWDVGRFAGRYRSLFNEFPSETLRTRRSPAR